MKAIRQYWINSVDVESWLRSELNPENPSDIRHHWTEDDVWYWAADLFDAGRTAMLGVHTSLLENTTGSALVSLLDSGGALTRLLTDDLLIVGEPLRFERWADAPHSEVWFQDHREENFVALDYTPQLVTWGGPPNVRLPTIVIRGKSWSGTGPAKMRADQCTAEELAAIVDAQYLG